MRIAILESGQAKARAPIDAHIRQAIFIERYLKSQGHSVDLLYLSDLGSNFVRNYDVIVKSYATFYDDFKQQTRIINNNPQARLFWLTNEYDLEIGGAFGKKSLNRDIDIIANFENDKPRFRHHYLVNLNSLFYQPKEKQEKKYNVCYYDTYRKDRALYFQKYFTSKDIFLSSSPKNFKKFASLKCTFTPVNKFMWTDKKDTLGLFQYSLYIEDEYTHTTFNNLADRFYEALSNQTVILFDKDCINTLKKSELKECDYEQFIISSPEDFKNRNYEHDWNIQQQWCSLIQQEKKKTLTTIENILTNT